MTRMHQGIADARAVLDTDLDGGTRPVTPGQMDFIAGLRKAYETAETELAALEGRKARHFAWVDPTDFDSASDMIEAGKAARTAIREELREARRTRREREQNKVTEGLWVVGTVGDGGTVYKVQRAADGPDHLYAKELDDDGWAYVGSEPFARIAAEGHPMTADEAAWLGQAVCSPLYGTCVNCGRALSHKALISRGYGEICAQHRGWPY